MLLDQLQDIILSTAELNKLLDIDLSSEEYGFESERLLDDLKSALGEKTLESVTNQRAKTLKENLKKAQKNKLKQEEIIKKSVNDKTNNKARNI